MTIFNSLSWIVLLITPAAHALDAGFAKIDITPTHFEGRPVKPRRPLYHHGDSFYDTGVDRQFDYEEAGAFGPDESPGRAGVDDDGNGVIDDCTRLMCKEYLAQGSDDLYDPHYDNKKNPNRTSSTERDKTFQAIYLGGFGPYFTELFDNRAASDVHDAIWSRAIALRGSNGIPLVLVSTDLPGLTWKFINPVKRRAYRELGIPTANIIIASTHNHAAPDAAGYWSTLLAGHNKDYTDQLKEWMFQSIREAYANLEPAHLKVITTTHVSCQDPQTLELKRDPNCNMNPIRKGTVLRADHPTNPPYDNPVLMNDLRDPVVRNTRIVAAQFLSASEDRTLGTFINWSLHPDTLKSSNMQISSDFPHFLRDRVERQLGGIAVYFSGTVGNQIGITGASVPAWDEAGNPLTDENGNRQLMTQSGWDLTRSIGFEIAQEVLVALQNESNIQSQADVLVRTEPLDIVVDNFLHRLFTGSVWHRDVEEPDMLHHYRSRCILGQGCVRQDVSVLQIGNLGMITSPGETDPAYLYGRTMVRAKFKAWFKKKITFSAMPGLDPYIPGSHHAVLGQANNYLSYLIPESDYVGWWNFNHPVWYEDLVTVSSHFGDDVGNKLAQMLGAPFRYSSRSILPRGDEVEERSLAQSATPTSDTADSSSSTELLWLGRMIKRDR